MFEDHVNNDLQTNKNKFNIIIPFANERVESAIALQNINNLFFLNIRTRDNPINILQDWFLIGGISVQAKNNILQYAYNFFWPKTR